MSDRFKNISDLHRAYEAKTHTVEGVVEAYLKRAESSSLNAFVTICRDRALLQARELDQKLQKNGGKIPTGQRLFGVPLGVKDALVMKDVRTTACSKILETYVPPYTATSVSRLEAEGAVTIGKLNMDEFAMGSSNENSAFGPVVHPTHSDRVPGGSSGGSAAAVVADLCMVSLGSDTGGSIRLPASYCGTVGMKPTYGRVSRYGLIAFASSLDQVGPFAHTVEDSALVLQVMAGTDPRDSTSSLENVPNWQTSASSLKGLRVGVPKEYFIDGIHPEVRERVEASLKLMEEAGAVRVPVSLPHTSYAVATYYVVAVCEASSNLARMDGVRFGPRPKESDEAKDPTEFYEITRGLFGSEVKRRIILGTFALSSGYYDAYYRKACQVRRLIQDDFLKAFEEVDVIVSPVSPTTAFKLGEKADDPLTMYLNDILTIPASLAGLPALSLPVGQDSEGLPIGMQFITPHFEEGRLFEVSRAVEAKVGGAH